MARKLRLFLADSYRDAIACEHVGQRQPSRTSPNVLREMERIEIAQNLARRNREPGGSPEETLRRFGLGIPGFIFNDTVVAFYNALAGELSRQPDLAWCFYSLGPGLTRANLTYILAAAAQRGQLAIADAEEAAEHLFGMTQGFSTFQLSLGVEGANVHKEIPGGARCEDLFEGLRTKSLKQDSARRTHHARPRLGLTEHLQTHIPAQLELLALGLDRSAVGLASLGVIELAAVGAALSMKVKARADLQALQRPHPQRGIGVVRVLVGWGIWANAC